MVNITLAIPPELKKRMDAFPELNWSAVARQAFDSRLKNLEFLRKFTENSTLTEEDALRLGRELNKSLHKKRYST